MNTIKNLSGGVARPRTFPDLPGPSLLETAFIKLARFADTMGRAAARRRTIRLLHSLDDRTLSDIGMKRGDIDAIVMSASRRDRPSGWNWRA
jgi:uncharacterized protein YjiS (DUF1127 family)